MKPETACLFIPCFFYLICYLRNQKVKFGNLRGMMVQAAARNKERRCAQVMVMVNDKEKESVKVNMRKQGKVCDVTEQARKPARKEMHLHGAVPLSPPPRAVRLPKPVDEDLYKIPPELLRTTKRVSHLTFFYLYFYNILVLSNPDTFVYFFC